MSHIIVAVKGRITAPQPGIAFMQLQHGQCRYPLGGPTDPPRRFCGVPAQPGSPYCPECRQIAYRPAVRR